MKRSAKIRLSVDQPLGPGQSVLLSRDQAHYLFSVMRLSVGDPLLVFNATDGEWRAVVSDAGKRGGSLLAEHQTRPAEAPPDLWLLFAPLKKARTDFVVEKATELGVSRICPVQTNFTNAERIRSDRMRAHATEAAEQCGSTYVPEVAELARLDRVLADWPQGRRLLFADEVGGGITGLSGPEGGSWAILIGPEGGFSDAERQRLLAQHMVTRLSLGPRILRAETAVVAALTLWHQALGGW